MTGLMNWELLIGFFHFRLQHWSCSWRFGSGVFWQWCSCICVEGLKGTKRFQIMWPMIALALIKMTRYITSLHWQKSLGNQGLQNKYKYKSWLFERLREKKIGSNYSLVRKIEGETIVYNPDGKSGLVQFLGTKFKKPSWQFLGKFENYPALL